MSFSSYVELNKIQKPHAVELAPCATRLSVYFALSLSIWETAAYFLYN